MLVHVVVVYRVFLQRQGVVSTGQVQTNMDSCIVMNFNLFSAVSSSAFDK